MAMFGNEIQTEAARGGLEEGAPRHAGGEEFVTKSWRRFSDARRAVPALTGILSVLDP